jgi:hypothetical protein
MPVKKSIKVSDRQMEWLNDMMEVAFQKKKGLWASSLLDVIEGLAPEQAAWKPKKKEARSIWEIVNHVALWKDVMVKRLSGVPQEKVAPLMKIDWPPVRAINGAAWKKSVNDLRSRHKAFIKVMAKLNAKDLERPTAQAKVKWGYHIYGVLAHDCYHAGQILTLRQLQGIDLE